MKKLTLLLILCAQLGFAQATEKYTTQGPDGAIVEIDGNPAVPGTPANVEFRLLQLEMQVGLLQNLVKILLDQHGGLTQRPEPHFRSFVTRCEIDTGSGYGRRDWNDDPKGIISDLLEIPGVSEAHATPYKVSISKSGAFEWEEIAPKVRDVIKGRPECQ